MRLTEQQQALIRKILLENFGSSSRVWVFGSRVDDKARGGDIDIYVEPDVLTAEDLIDAKLRSLVALKRKLGDQKIDIVIRRPGSDVDLPIYEIARTKGVRL